MSHKYKTLELPEEGYWKCNVCLGKVFPVQFKNEKVEPISKYWSSITGCVYCGAEHSMQDVNKNLLKNITA